MKVLVKDIVSTMDSLVYNMMNICELLNMYLRKTFDFLLFVRGESNSKKGQRSIEIIYDTLLIVKGILQGKSIEVNQPAFE